ncbi:MAG TPA: DUF1674 domain-containing protein [Gammaproteobacteria bacterium]|nr:DUF1674 domain-containing protein [Gammaproteobacteria bacterium]
MPVERAPQSAGGDRPPSNTRSNGVDDRLPAEPEGGSAPGREIGGPKGLEPTRYGDWERAGRCIDF